ncbi:hypothetical protein DEU52_1138 [Ensifer adhaerens]|nr:hypothetical protein DEU52_1138 [Ensifer adhaerens]
MRSSERQFSQSKGGIRSALLDFTGAVMDGSRDVPLDENVRRTLRDRTGPEDVYFEQLCTFSGDGRNRRDLRWSSISVAYLALISHSKLAITGGRLKRLDVGCRQRSPGAAVRSQSNHRGRRSRLRGKGAWSNLPAYLLDDEFTISQLNRVYSAVTSTSSKPPGKADQCPTRGHFASLDSAIETSTTSLRQFRDFLKHRRLKEG